MRDLKDAGVHTVLREASRLLKANGHAVGMHRNPATGFIDAEAAIMLACGARDLPIMVKLITDYVAPNQRGIFDATVNVVEAAVLNNIVTWSDECSESDVTALLESLADDIDSAIV